MDHRVRVASIVLWALFFVNFFAAGYAILQYIMAQTIFGDVPMVFLAVVNAVVAIVTAVSMSVGESYRV